MIFHCSPRLRLSPCFLNGSDVLLKQLALSLDKLLEKTNPKRNSAGTGPTSRCKFGYVHMVRIGPNGQVLEDDAPSGQNRSSGGASGGASAYLGIKVSVVFVHIVAAKPWDSLRL